jgi:hypothetical protein
MPILLTLVSLPSQFGIWKFQINSDKGKMQLLLGRDSNDFSMTKNPSAEQLSICFFILISCKAHISCLNNYVSHYYFPL